jgi:hypothetical protein
MKLVKSVVRVALLVSFALVGLSTAVVAQSLTTDAFEGQLK